MRKLTNPNAIPAAVRLYEYICALQGKKCLTGQMESGWCGTYEHEINYLLSRTGTMPAIRGWISSTTTSRAASAAPMTGMPGAAS